jgi:pimeloyl-ACP methyl ester carboxylesterase
MLDTHRVGSLASTSSASTASNTASSTASNTSIVGEEGLVRAEGGFERYPILLIHGVQDDIVPIARARLFAESLSTADSAQVVVLEEIPHADHAVYSAPLQVRQTTSIVQDWLRTTECLEDAPYLPPASFEGLEGEGACECEPILDSTPLDHLGDDL